jgi:hypothetical protein
MLDYFSYPFADFDRNEEADIRECASLKYYFYSYRNLSPNLTGLSDYRLYLDG